MSLISYLNPARSFLDLIHGAFGYDSYRGERAMPAAKALTYAPVWMGVSKIGGHISQLPIGVYRRVEGGGELEPRHSVSVLMKRPNDYQTKSVFLEQIAGHAIIEGNGRAAIVREGARRDADGTYIRGSGRIRQLIPLHPEVTHTGLMEGIKLHATRPSRDDPIRRYFEDINGNEDGEGIIMLDDSEVLHFLGLSLDGIVGIPLRQAAARNLNGAIDAETRVAKQMEQGFSGSIFVTAPAGMFRTEEDGRRFMEQFKKRHHDKQKAGEPGLLRDGMSVQVLQSTNTEAQMVENRRFDRQTLAMFLGLETILGDNESISYNSFEHKSMEYHRNCLSRWLRRLAEEMEVKLLPRRQFDRDSHYIEFDISWLLKSDYKTMLEAGGIGITHRILSPNEVRRKLSMLPYEGGDKFENPAITPGESTAEQTEENDSSEVDEESTPEDPSTSAVATENVIRSRLSVLIKAEARKLIQLSGRDDFDVVKFSDAVENYYWSFTTKMGDVLEEVGIDRDQATTYCDESKKRLVQLLGETEPEDFARALRQQVRDWPNRAESLINKGALTYV